MSDTNVKKPETEAEFEERVRDLGARLDQNDKDIEAAGADMAKIANALEELEAGLDEAEHAIEAEGGEIVRSMDKAIQELEARLKKVEEEGDE
jgi:hypothetical protein